MNFALIMFVLLLVTGSIWLLDRFALHPGGRCRRAVVGGMPRVSFRDIVVFIRSFLIEPFKTP